METKRKVEIVGISIALVVVARHFVSKYHDTLKYWEYMYLREEKFKGLYLKNKARSLFARGEEKLQLRKEAERCRKKAAWYLKQIGNNIHYEK